MPAIGKSEPDSLAIFGAPPAFAEKIHVGRPNLPDRGRLWGYLNDIMDRAWLTNNGAYVRRLEEEIAGRLNVKHCIATCSGTMALEIAVRALGLTGEVIVPSMTFVATPHALRWLGLKPAFCDIDPHSHNLDPDRVEDMMTHRTSGIVGVHLWGRPCDVQALSEIAHRNKLRLIFDAAHAFACSHRGTMIGNFGDAEILSFHATKFFNTFEGGALVTNADDVASAARAMREFGLTSPEVVDFVGTNGKMHEVSAAAGLALLAKLDDLITANRHTYMHYRRELDELPGISLLSYDEREECNYQYIILEVDESIAGISRDLLLEVLHAENVLARRYFYPGCHRLEPYRSALSIEDSALPQTEYVAQRVLCLPTGPTLGPNDVGRICQIIRTAIRRSGEIVGWMSHDSRRRSSHQ